MWITPIIDRQISDIQNMTQKGHLNAEDLNRIEGNTQYLHEVLLGYGYSQSPITKTNWVMAEFPYIETMERMRKNTKEIIEGYYDQPTQIPLSIETLTWQKLNDIEKALLETKEMISKMEESYRYAGTFYVGQEVIL